MTLFNPAWETLTELIVCLLYSDENTFPMCFLIGKPLRDLEEERVEGCWASMFDDKVHFST